MMISATAPEGIDVADYLDSDVVPALENIGGVAQVELAGAQDEYLRIVLDEAAMQQYGLSISTVGSAIAAADFDMPVGQRVSGFPGHLPLACTAMWRSTPASGISPSRPPPARPSSWMTSVPSSTSMRRRRTAVSRYNGQESVMLTVTKQNSASTMEVCNAVQDVLDQYSVDGVSFEISYSEGDSIMETMGEILNTLITGVILTMIVLFIFFGDLKASLIVGISMPLSILLAVILLNFAGYNIDLMTGSALIIAIGMIVDNSHRYFGELHCAVRRTAWSSKRLAAVGTSTMLMSILAGTLTTGGGVHPHGHGRRPGGHDDRPSELDSFPDPDLLLPVRSRGGSPGFCVAQAPVQGRAHHQPRPGAVQGFLPPHPAPAAAPPRPGGVGGRGLFCGRHPAHDPDGIRADGQQL